MIFFTADQHFGHKNIMKYEDRPFESVEEMDEGMIQRWNEVVTSQNDVIYVVGDVTFSKKEAYVRSILERLNGHKVLIRGNHDYFASKVWAEKYFDEIHDYLEVKYDDVLICLMHYPLASWNKRHHGALHIHGHIHSNVLPFDLNGRVFNAGVDVNDFRPVSFDEVWSVCEGMKFGV